MTVTTRMVAVRMKERKAEWAEIAAVAPLHPMARQADEGQHETDEDVDE